MTARLLRLFLRLFQLEAPLLLGFACYGTSHMCARTWRANLKNISHVTCERNSRNSVTTRVPAVTGPQQAKHTRARPPSPPTFQKKRKGLR